MEKLTGKQNRYLRSLGQTLGDSVVIGRAGLSESVAAHICKLLEARELIKVRMSDAQGAERKEFAAEIAAATDSVCAGVTGRTMLLYKPNPDLPKTERIKLPGIVNIK